MRLRLNPVASLRRLSSRARIALAVSAALFLVSIAAILGLWDWLTDDGPPAEEIQAELMRALPVGTSADEVREYLTRKNRAFDEMEADPERDTLASRSGLAKGTPLIVSSYGDRGDDTIIMYFVLDSTGTLDRIIVEERPASSP